jgi:hypothetical protein
MRKLIAGLALLGCCTAASADMVYHWETIDANGATSMLLGELRIADTAPGGASIDFRPTTCTYNPATCAPGQERGDPTSPIISFMFRLDDGHAWLNENFREGIGFPDAQRVVIGIADLADVIGSGRISSGGSYAVIEMSGAGGLWTIDQMNSELNLPDMKPCWLDACVGITGRWVLDATAVPTPATLPLVLLGLAGVGATLIRGRSLRQSEA